MIRPAQLSNRELLSNTKKHVRAERTETLAVLEHLSEIDKRRLYLWLGYSSLFRYSVDELKYSSSAAGRRIQTARCMRRFPEIKMMLRREEATLSTIDRIARILRSDNRSELLARIRGKSDREVESIACEYRPPARLVDRVRPVRVAVADDSHASTPGTDCEKSSNSRHGSAVAATKARRGQEVATSQVTESTAQPIEAPAKRTRIAKRLHIQFLAGEPFMAKYERARALLSNRIGAASFENVFDTLLDDYLERHDPAMKSARRDKRRRNAGDKPKRSRRDGQNSDDTPSRHIPSAIRDAVYKRDGNRCTFVGENGTRCGETQHLHVDHVEPVARGGRHTVSNLRLLCAGHNFLAAERTYGADFMRQYRRRE